MICDYLIRQGNSYTGDGGLATAAALNQPRGVAVDASGNLFIADKGNNVIRKVNVAGVISTIAGTGRSGYAGDRGLALLAELSAPLKIMVDGAGDIFIADQTNNAIREVNSIGVISTIVSLGYSTDGIPSPSTMTVDLAGNLFVSVLGSLTIGEINAAGVASNITVSRVADNAQAMAADTVGDLFTTHGNAVYKISAGIAITVAATSNQPPTLNAIANQVATQGSVVTVVAQATDSDVGQTLTFSLDTGAPAGATINPSSGVFSWAVPSSQAAGDYPITVRVTDNGSPPLSDAKRFTIHVSAANHAPVLSPIGNHTVIAGQTVALTAQATDPDPGQTLTYSLNPGAPAGAMINPSTGTFSWSVPATQVPGDYPVTVRVTDNGSPPLSAAQTFIIHVQPLPPKVVGGQVRTIKVSKKKTQTVIVLNVSGSIDPTSAQNLANYRLGLPGKHKQFGTKYDRLTKLSSAVYNAAARTITLIPKGGSLNLSQALTLRVSGLSSNTYLMRVTKRGVTLLT